MSAESTAAVEVVRSVSVPMSQARTFELFTTRMTDFWPKEHSIGSSEIAQVVVEPHTGGRWFGIDDDGSETEWGDVLVWEPPGRLVLAWRIGANWQYNANLLTEVEVTFTEEADGRTHVELAHRKLQRYGDADEQMRAIFDHPDGWTGTLTRFADLAAS